MKKIILLTIAAGLTFLNFKCDEEGVVVDFNFTSPSVQFSIEPVQSVGEIETGGEEVDLKIDSVFEANNISKETLKGAKISSMTFVVTAPANGNFNALDYIEVYISAPSAGLAEVAVGKTPNPMPQDAKSIEMDTDDTDLAPYIKAGKVSFKIKAKNNDKIEEKIDMKASIKFTLSGQVL